MGRYKQGKFVPSNPQKYVGDLSKITYRSGWEHKFMQMCDHCSGIIQWNSEEVIVPYFDQVDGKNHRYYMDFWLRVKSKDNNTLDYLIEVKPFQQTKPPTKPKALNEKNKRTYAYAMATYLKNQQKWTAAEKYAKERQMIFKVVTEKELPQFIGK